MAEAVLECPDVAEDLYLATMPDEVEPARPVLTGDVFEDVAFPAISTGVYGYPIEAAAAIGVETVRSTLTGVREVKFVAFEQETADAYTGLL